VISTDVVDLAFFTQNAGAGRTRVQFEVEVVAHNDPFTGTTTTKGTNVDTGVVSFVAPRVFLPQPLPGRGFKVRGRWRTPSPHFPRTRWITPETHTSGDHDVRLAGTSVGLPPGGADALGRGAPRIDAVSPNPSQGPAAASRVAFLLPAEAHVTLDVFDLRGARVRRLLGERRAAGPSAISWDGRDDAGRAAPAGIYFVILRAGGAEARAKAVRLP
jgi:hypothetical protein